VKLLQPNAEYTFRSYFELPQDTDEVLAEFDYKLVKKSLDLPKTERKLAKLAELREQIEAIIPLVPLSSETAKREILVAPILSLVAITCQQILRIEYPLRVNNLLQGSLDYLLRGVNYLIVIEAKRDDLTKGFTQMAVEMIALSLVQDSPSTIYGAVTMGNLWTFGILEESSRTIFQDILSYRVPSDLEELVRVLVGILE
jgi:hypothetical protein